MKENGSNNHNASRLVLASAVILGFGQIMPSFTDYISNPPAYYCPVNISKQSLTYNGTIGIIDNLPVYNNSTTALSDGGVNAMSEKKMKNLEKLDSFNSYEVNWNGNNASPISKELISMMKGLVITLSYQPEIFPTACDSIQFEYEKDDGAYLEFELFENKIIRIYSVDSKGLEEESRIAFDSGVINEVVNKFYGIKL